MVIQQQYGSNIMRKHFLKMHLTVKSKRVRVACEKILKSSYFWIFSTKFFKFVTRI